jgi:TolA-binding protein
MDQRTGTPEVFAFAPKQKPPEGSDPIDQAGQAVVATLREAANISKENVDRAMTLAHRLSMQLRATEDRISQLQGEVELLRSRATRAEQWLETIKTEIQDKLIAPMEANRPGSPAAH